MNDAKTDEATLRLATDRYDAIQEAAVRSIESPAKAKAELDALEERGPLIPAECVVYWTKLANEPGHISGDDPRNVEVVKSVHSRLVERILAYFDVKLPS